MRIQALLAAAALAAAAAAHAGPPLICHPVEIGDARSLPWGSGAFDAERSFDLEALPARTVALLKDSGSVLVHMETLRRASIYAERDRDAATALLARVMARALDAEASGRPDALAWLDAGYLVQCLAQLGVDDARRYGAAEGVAGYAWVRRALALAGDDAALEFAAAMVTVQAGIPQHAAHARRARELAGPGSPVARNLEAHATRYWPGHRGT